MKWPRLPEAGSEIVLFGHEELCCAIERVGSATHPLFAVEREALGEVVARRVAEFGTGRHCARLGLRQLGVEPVALPIGGGGAPEWPEGLVGSIAHGADLAGAVVARSDRYLALGLDIELCGSVTPELHELLFTDAERNAPVDPALATLLFSAKEAIYKAAFPKLQRWIDFTEVTVSVDAESATFRGRSVAPTSDLALLESGEGSFTIQGDAILTLFRILS